MKRLITFLRSLLCFPVPVQIRAAVLNLWNSVRYEVVTVEQWKRKVIVRALTLDEWLEYSRMAKALTSVNFEPDEDQPEPLPPEEWQKYGERALLAFVLVATLHDHRQRPVFALEGPERAADIAAVASGFSDVHDHLVACALRLSGITAAPEGEPAPDPVAEAGNA